MPGSATGGEEKSNSRSMSYTIRKVEPEPEDSELPGQKEEHPWMRQGSSGTPPSRRTSQHIDSATAGVPDSGNAGEKVENGDAGVKEPEENGFRVARRPLANTANRLSAIPTRAPGGPRPLPSGGNNEKPKAGGSQDGHTELPLSHNPSVARGEGIETRDFAPSTPPPLFQNQPLTSTVAVRDFGIKPVVPQTPKGPRAQPSETIVQPENRSPTTPTELMQKEGFYKNGTVGVDESITVNSRGDVVPGSDGSVTVGGADEKPDWNKKLRAQYGDQAIDDAEGVSIRSARGAVGGVNQKLRKVKSIGGNGGRGGMREIEVEEAEQVGNEKKCFCCAVM